MASKTEQTLKASTLEQHLSINRQMANLYRTYKRRILDDKVKVDTNKDASLNFMVFAEELGFTRRGSFKGSPRRRNQSLFVSANKFKVIRNAHQEKSVEKTIIE